MACPSVARSLTACPLDETNLVTTRAARWSGAAPTSRSTSASRPAEDSAGARRDAAAVLRWGGITDPAAAAGDRRRRRVLPRRRSRPGARDRRDRRSAPVRRARRHARGPAAQRQHSGGLPGVGRPGRADRGRPERPRAGGDRASCPSWHAGATGSASSAASNRSSPAAAPRGSCTGEHSNALAVLSDEGATMVAALTAPGSG